MSSGVTWGVCVSCGAVVFRARKAWLVKVAVRDYVRLLKAAGYSVRVQPMVRTWGEYEQGIECEKAPIEVRLQAAFEVIRLQKEHEKTA